MNGADEAGRSLYLAVDRLARAMRHHRQQFATEHGLTLLQTSILETLETRQPMRVGTLADELEVSQPTVSAAAAVLVDKGLVRKTTDAVDRRVVALALTEEGAAIADAVVDFAPAATGVVAATGQPADRGAVVAGLLREMQALHYSGRMATNHTCFTCRFLDESGTERRCALMKMALPDEELRADCPEHSPLVPGGRDGASA